MEKANKVIDGEQSDASLRQTDEQLNEELDEFRERFVQINKLAEIGQLTAGILHEIQNPLNFINNFSRLSVDLVGEIKEILEKKQEQSLTGDEREDLLFLLNKLEGVNTKVSENGGRIGRIIQSMLVQTRSDNKTAQFDPVDLNQLLEEFTKLAYQGIRGEDRSFNVSFLFQLDPAVGLVKLVATEISRVVLNLVNNACYAINEKRKLALEGYTPQLAVSSVRLSDRIEIKIRDNGMGIPDEVKEKIFTIFFTTKPVGKGSGLGLALSRDIVTVLHKGHLSVHSEPGNFTEFTIQLPLNL